MSARPRNLRPIAGALVGLSLLMWDASGRSAPSSARDVGALLTISIDPQPVSLGTDPVVDLRVTNGGSATVWFEGLLRPGFDIRTMTLPDTFQEHDDPAKQYAAAGLAADDIARIVSTHFVAKAQARG